MYWTNFRTSENSIPKLEVPANISVTSGQPVEVVVVATDDDNDKVTYALLDDDGGRQSIDPNTGVISATFNASRPSTLGWVNITWHSLKIYLSM